MTALAVAPAVESVAAEPEHVYRIGLSGKAGSGKTALAKRLVADFGFHRMSFAGRLKEELADLLDISLADFELNKAHWRLLMQEWGSARRYQSEYYWVRKLLVRLPINRGVPVVIDDLRYENEAHVLKREGFFLVRLDCSSLESLAYLRSGGTAVELADLLRSHPSEMELDNYDAFDLRINAPRTRPLTEIYAELLEGIGWEK
jgi:hypothetical protein